MPVRTLSSVLSEVNVEHVDLFVLDVEGFELPVLSGIDFDQHDISHILVEASDVSAVQRCLAPRYQLVVALSHHDSLFARVTP